MMSEKYLGPKQWPPHQTGKDDIIPQCKKIMSKREQSNIAIRLCLTFRITPYIANRKIGEKMNNPRAGLNNVPAKASKKYGVPLSWLLGR
jgi:hypothetical protein